jgi:WD40 repeat protein
MTDADEQHPGRSIRVNVLTPGLTAVILLAAGGLMMVATDPEHDPALRKVLGTHPAAVRLLAFSPDGRTLAVGDLDGSVGLWDVTTRQCRLALRPRSSLAVPPGLQARPLGCGGRRARSARRLARPHHGPRVVCLLV